MSLNGCHTGQHGYGTCPSSQEVLLDNTGEHGASASPSTSLKQVLGAQGHGIERRTWGNVGAVFCTCPSPSALGACVYLRMKLLSVKQKLKGVEAFTLATDQQSTCLEHQWPRVESLNPAA